MFYYRPVAEYAYADMKYLEVRHAFRHAHAQHAPLGSSRDDRLCLAAHVQSFSNRVLQAAARIQLDRRRSSAGSNAAIELYRLSACPGTSSSIWAVTVGSNMARATPLAW